MGSTAPDTIRTDVLIVGAGFSGVYALHMIRKLGLSVKLIEKGSGYGGVWHWNRYPGARVDSEMPTYQLNIPEIHETWNWSCRYPDHHELRAYFAHVAKVLDLEKDTTFNTLVQGATWEDGEWNIFTQDGPNYVCKYFLPCVGFAFQKHYPDFRGLENYKGLLVHSAEYPEDLDLKGKRIAVLGNGASGVQCIQEIAREDCQLTAFIRNINTAYPMGQRTFDVFEQNISKSFYDCILRAGRHTASGYPYNPPPSVRWNELHPEISARLMENAWRRGGFTFHLSTTGEFVFDKEVNRTFYDFWKERTRARVSDPVKRDIVAPEQQPYWIGTKRPSLEQYYYESIDRPNVSVVDLKRNPIDHFTADGIVTTDGTEHKLDVVLFATGYDFWTGGLTNMNIRDKNGLHLKEKWPKGCETHLGLSIPGCPNLFYAYGPQSPAALGSTLPIIETQVEWICKALSKMKSEGIKYVEPQAGPAKKWRQTIQDHCSQTLYADGSNYYIGTNIPGKPREQLPWIGGTDVYIQRCNEALDGWEGFDVVFDEAPAP
ncbi:Cyclopentanone 1,2-monooxygenase [Fonsecaea pedrosoi]|nr:Cyclopentanone 1,2-monooxygenase [Fonsecaea pedrosoi]